MRRASFIAKLLCVGFLVSACGCHFFGIDTREGIEYVTVNDRKSVKEPMYTRSVPGTNLVKRWPKRMGVNYGYAPWERKRNPQMVGADRLANATPIDPTSPDTGPIDNMSPPSARTAGVVTAATGADPWHGRSGAVRQASAESAAEGAEISVRNAYSARGAMAGATDRPLNAATDSTAKPIYRADVPMTIDPLLPIDQAIVPGYTPYALPVMTENRPPVVVQQPAGSAPMVSDSIERQKNPQPSGGIKLTNPLRP